MKKSVPIYDQITIIGGGLIGVSLAKIVKKNKLVNKLKIYDKSKIVRDRLQTLKIADEVCETLKDSVNNSDLTVLAIPVGSMGEVSKSISGFLKKESVLTETGSTKISVISEIKPNLPKNVWFIPSHPLAGTENSGPDAGYADLFKGKYWILLPDNEVPSSISKKLEKFYSSCGAITEFMKPDYHDKILAITSHLPHLIAYTIVGTATDLEEQTKHDVVRFSATGFRDFTRIAASDPIMWRDVFLNNRDAVLEMLQRFNEDLSYLQRSIRWSEGEKLEKLFTRTREIRRSIIQEGQDK